MSSFYHNITLGWYKKFTWAGTALLLVYICALYTSISHSVDIYPVRYDATLSEGIDFSRDGYPKFIDKVSGFSVRESWGRWTNQYRGDIKIIFKTPLPKNFTLKFDAIAFNLNGNSPTIIRIGDQKKEILISSEKLSTYSIEFANINNINAIEIIPPSPISPAQIDPTNKDGRLLGIGFHTLKVINNEN